MKLKEDAKYGFVCGRIRFLEKLFLTKEIYERLLREENEDGFLKVLKETPYQQLKDAELENVSFLRKHCLDDWVKDALLLKYDLHNVKVLIKSQILKKDLSIYLSPLGTIPIEYLNRLLGFSESKTDFAISSNFTALTKNLSEVVKNTIRTYEATKEGALVDAILDRYFFEAMYEKAKQGDFLKEYFSLTADLKNISAVIRIKKLGEEKKFSELEKFLLPFGKLAKDFFVKILSEPWEEIEKIFSKTPYREIVTKGVNYLIKKNSFLILEKLSKEMLLAFCKLTRYLIFGYEILVAYYLQKENEIENLNKILNLRIRKGLPLELVREALVLI